MSRLKDVFTQEYEQWRKEKLSSFRYAYIWADGAIGFWKALPQVFPSTRMQRCWVHKTANILDKLPKSVQPRAKTLIHDIYQAETEESATAAFTHFCDSYRDK